MRQQEETLKEREEELIKVKDDVSVCMTLLDYLSPSLSSPAPAAAGGTHQDELHSRSGEKQVRADLPPAAGANKQTCEYHV